MGSRIHRAMGWVTTHPDSAALRNRLHETGEDGEVDRWVDSVWQASAENGSLQRSISRERKILSFEDSYPKQFRDLCHQVCGPDYCQDNWIVAPPSYAMSWFRVDDDIDWHDIRNQPDWDTIRINRIPTAIHPYGNATSNPHVVPSIIWMVAAELGLETDLLAPAVATWWR